jgi:Uroporphyrinogen-III methylase
MSKSGSKNGKVYLVGAGPGDLGLVTLRAKERIENADVIVYDHLANPDMLGWARGRCRNHLCRETTRRKPDAAGNHFAADR